MIGAPIFAFASHTHAHTMPRLMQWIAPEQKDSANSTLEKRLWDAAAKFRANSDAFLEHEPTT
jgi:hypothetical protein